MHGDEHDQQQRRQPDVNAEELVQRQRVHDRAALQPILQERTGNRRRAGDIQRDLRCKVGVEIPRQQIACKPEDQRENEQDDADDPLQLARTLVCAPHRDLHEVHRDQRDHRRRTPIVEADDELAERDLLVDEERRFPCARRRRRVVHRKEDARDDLQDHREERRASENVPIRRSAGDVLGEEVLRHADEAGA